MFSPLYIASKEELKEYLCSLQSYQTPQSEHMYSAHRGKRTISQQFKNVCSLTKTVNVTSQNKGVAGQSLVGSLIVRLWLVLTDYGFLIKLHFNTSKLSLYLQNNPYSTNIWLNYAPKHGYQAIGVCIIVTSRTPPLHPLSVSQIQRVSAFIQVFTHIHTVTRCTRLSPCRPPAACG